MRPNSELGAGWLKTIVALFLIGMAGFVISRVFPPYFANSQLADKMRQEARFADANERTNEQLRETIYSTARRIKIPLRREDIQIERTPSGTRISADYSVTVDLRVYELVWDFHTTSAR